MIKKILKQFQIEYDFLYENHDNVAGYEEALEAGEEWLAEKHELAGRLIKERQDFFSSDREVAALAFALAHFNLI